MARARSHPATPQDRVRDLARQMGTVEQEAPGPARAARLAPLVREAHRERQLNLVMHAAQLCLADDPDAPDLLVAAYVVDDEPSEERLRALQDLAALAGYVGREDLGTLASTRLLETARAWIEDVEDDEAGRRHRLRRLSSILPREQVDQLRDELGTGR